MSFFDHFQSGLEKIVGPVTEKITTNRFIMALTEGFMCTMPITLGTAVIAVLANLPIKAWSTLLNNTGIYAVAQDFIALTLSLLAVYVVGAVAYCYTKNEKQNAITGALLALASFMVLLPIEHITNETGMAVSMLKTSYLGSEGIFVAILCGMFVSWMYCALMRKNLQLKMPDAVPPMVSKSLSPMFVAMIIFTIMFVIKYVCTLTPYGNLFTVINTLVAQPIAKFGASPVALISVFFLMNLFWFFGIHPNAILSCYMPILMMVGAANTQAFIDGKELPYFMFAVLGGVVQIGGAGNTLGLCIATFFAKSEKYKTMRKIFLPANIFNINEPIIFGFPVMLNPLYFIPMILSPIVSGIVAIFLAQILPIHFNPTISMPWVTPGFVTVFLGGGFPLLLIWLVSLGIHTLMYFPFFLMDDKRTRLEEQASAN